MTYLFVHRLLEILSGHKRRREWTGEVLINGSNLPKNYRYASTYVVKVTPHNMLTGCVYEQDT